MCLCSDWGSLCSAGCSAAPASACHLGHHTCPSPDTQICPQTCVWVCSLIESLGLALQPVTGEQECGDSESPAARALWPCQARSAVLRRAGRGVCKTASLGAPSGAACAFIHQSALLFLSIWEPSSHNKSKNRHGEPRFALHTAHLLDVAELVPFANHSTWGEAGVQAPAALRPSPLAHDHLRRGRHTVPALR